MKIKNVTDTDTTGKYTFPTPDGGIVKGIDLFIEDIPNIRAIKWRPGQTIDLSDIATSAQVDQSRHLKVHLNEGRMVIIP